LEKSQNIDSLKKKKSSLGRGPQLISRKKFVKRTSGNRSLGRVNNEKKGGPIDQGGLKKEEDYTKL